MISANCFEFKSLFSESLQNFPVLYREQQSITSPDVTSRLPAIFYFKNTIRDYRIGEIQLLIQNRFSVTDNPFTFVLEEGTIGCCEDFDITKLALNATPPVTLAEFSNFNIKSFSFYNYLYSKSVPCNQYEKGYTKEVAPGTFSSSYYFSNDKNITIPTDFLWKRNSTIFIATRCNHYVTKIMSVNMNLSYLE